MVRQNWAVLRSEPCGTPFSVVYRLYVLPLTDTLNVLAVKKF